MLAIEAVNLTKKYGNFTAVDQLNLSIEEGEAFGFLGPNGAGKTTTLLMLLGLTEPTSGMARVYGYNSTKEPLKVKRLIGYLPEKVGFYEDLTAKENLQYTTRLNGIEESEARRRINEVLERVGLLNVADQKVSQFSRGMKQRLGIADVLVKEPKVVFLDEPTAGIDPKGVDEILELINDMKKRGITLVFCSHLLHHVQRICTRIGIMAKGRLVVEGAIDRLGKEAIAGGRYRVEVKVMESVPGLINSLKQIEGVLNVEESEGVFLISCDTDLRPQIAKTIVDSGASLMEMKIEEYSIEEIYRKYFGEG